MGGWEDGRLVRVGGWEIGEGGRMERVVRVGGWESGEGGRMGDW